MSFADYKKSIFIKNGVKQWSKSQIDNLWESWDKK
jgi:hypothetical protein